MPIVRSLLAVGAGAVIALSHAELGATQDLSALTEPEKVPSAESYAAQPLPHTQEHLTVAQKTRQESPSAEVTNATSLTSDAARSAAAASQDPSPTERNSAEATAHSEKFPPKSNRVEEGNPATTPDKQDKPPSVVPVSVQSLPTRRSAQSLKPGSIAQTEGTQPGQILRPQTPILEPQPSTSGPQTPAPSFLNPNANPLLFPTKSEEVQLRAVQPITLQQALELARRNNRQLQVATLTLQRSQAALREALAAEYPTIGVQSDFTRTESEGGQNDNQLLDQLLGRTADDTDITTALSTRLEVNYDFFTAGRRGAAIRAAEEQLRFDRLDVERQAEQLRLDVTNAYYDLQEADAQVEIALAAVTDALRNLRDTELLERAGLGTRFDVLRAQVTLANNNQDLTLARSQQSIARRQLAQLLSINQTVEITAADVIQVAGVWDLSLEQSIVLALKNRAELEQQLARRNISEQQRRIALAAINPQVGVFASYGLTQRFNEGREPTDSFQLGARFRWDFFDGGAARARAAQERTNIAIAETQFADRRNQIRFEVEQSYSNLVSNRENIQTTFFAVTQAEESLRLAELRFRSGVGTQTDVINAQTELTRARVNRLRAVLDYNRALAALQRAISNLPDSRLFDTP